LVSVAAVVLNLSETSWLANGASFASDPTQHELLQKSRAADVSRDPRGFCPTKGAQPRALNKGAESFAEAMIEPLSFSKFRISIPRAEPAAQQSPWKEAPCG
jgi:hypothetical protein